MAHGVDCHGCKWCLSDLALPEHDPLVACPPHSEIHQQENNSYSSLRSSLQGGAGLCR